MSLGVLDNDNAVGSTGEPCDNCPICCKKWQKMHLPIYHEQLVRVFQSSTGRSVLPLPVADNDPGNLTNIIKNRKYWVEWIFDRPHDKSKSDSSRIVQLKRDSSGNFKWGLGWVDISTPLFLPNDVWVGENLFEEDRVRTRIVTVADTN